VKDVNRILAHINENLQDLSVSQLLLNIFLDALAHAWEIVANLWELLERPSDASAFRFFNSMVNYLITSMKANENTEEMNRRLTLWLANYLGVKPEDITIH